MESTTSPTSSTPSPGDDDLGTESYGGERGDNGVPASRDAAHADYLHGVTNAAQKYVLILANQAGTRGITVAEAREKSGTLHHGRVSSALTKQHIAGRLVALHERRGNAGIYVLPEFVDGREIRPYRRAHRIDGDGIISILRAHRYAPIISTTMCACGIIVGGRGGHEQHLTDVLLDAVEGRA